MLTLGTSLDNTQVATERANKKARLSQLKRELALYFGFTSKEEVAEALALRQTLGARDRQQPDNQVQAGVPGNVQSVQTAIQNASVQVDPALKQVFSDIIDDGDEAKRYLDNLPNTESLKKTIQDRLIVTGTNGSAQTILENYRKCIKFHYSAASIHKPSGTSYDPAYYNVNQQNNSSCMFFNNLDNAILGSTPEEVKKRIVAVRMDQPLLTPGEKNGELLTVFFNAMPALELTRATPVMNVTIFFSRPPITENGKLSSLTLQKFLEGAVEEQPETQENLPLRALNLASVVSGSTIGQPDSNYTVVGLELFRAPQTLQNIEASKQQENRLAPVIDPMRPLASIKAFSLEMQSAYGLQGTRNGSLEIVLHDRSRLGEFANFVKPDRYGTAFLEVEYGWSHPDPLEAGNPYADLLNLTRIKDHLNIVSTNLTFDEVGQVNITLNLIGRGTSETTELSIIGPESTIAIRQQLDKIEQLSNVINQLSTRVFGTTDAVEATNQNQSNQSHRQEIRGIQALNAAQDAVNNLVLSSEVIEKIEELKQTLAARATAGDERTRSAASQLRDKINELLGTVQGSGQNRRTSGGAINEFQSTISNEISNILREINTATNQNATDIFLQTMPDIVKSKLRSAGMQVPAGATNNTGQRSANRRDTGSTSRTNTSNGSGATGTTNANSGQDDLAARLASQNARAVQEMREAGIIVPQSGE